MSRRDVRAYRAPRDAMMGPVNLNCPQCDTPLGFAARVTVESARQAAKRPPLPEAFVTCPNCRRAWVAGLWLSLAAFAGSEVAA